MEIAYPLTYSFLSKAGTVYVSSKPDRWAGTAGSGGSRRAVRALYVVLVAVALGGVAGGLFLNRGAARQLRARVESEIKAVADLKATQIAQWRNERLGDAGVLMDNPLLRRNLSEFFGDADGVLDDDIAAHLQSLCERYGYSQVVLVDGTGRIRSEGPDGVESAEGVVLDAVQESFRDGEPRISLLHRGGAVSEPHVAVVAPVLHDGGDPAGAIVLVMSAKRTLYPLIRSWPTQNRTAESLLVRSDGDAALFLSDARHLSDAALSTRVELSRSDVPSVMAVQGRTGVVTGSDYRGSKVVAAIAPVTGSSWLVVAKQDESEAFASVHVRTVYGWILLGSFLLLSAASIALLLQHDRRRHFERLYFAESERRRMEERNRVVLHSIGDGVVATDADGRVETMNPAAEALSGWSAPEAVGRPLEEVLNLVGGQTREKTENPVRLAIGSRALTKVADDTVLVARDGTERQIADSAAPVMEKGVVTGAVMVFRDVTRENAATAELRLNEEYQRALIESSPMAIMSLDRDGKVLTWNPAAERIFGWKASEVVGTMSPLASVGAENDSDTLRNRVLSGEYLEGLEISRKRRDGTTVDLSLSAAPIRDPQGRTIAFINVMQDIAERKELEGERERLRQVIEQSGESVMITDADDAIEYVNPAFEDITGYSRSEALGRSPRFLKSGRHSEDFFAEMWRVLSGGNPWRGRITNKRKDGTLFDVESIISPVRDSSGRIVNYAAVQRDVTHETRLEEQLRQAQKMEAIGHLAGGVAHDFNNILQAMMGYCELLDLSIPEGDRLREYVSELMKATERSATLTRQLLTFSRQQVTEMKDLELNGIVTDIFRMIKRTIGEQIEVEIALAAERLPVRADPGQIEQVVMNLSINARDAMPHGGTLAIGTSIVEIDEEYRTANPWAVPGRYAMMSVTDTGMGMDEVTLSQVFEPFFTTKEVGSGTGLGLATVYGIVKKHEGLIHVYSEVGIGTTFKVYLPLGNAAAAEPPPDRAEPAAGGHETILLAEDDQAVRGLTERILRDAGYDLIVARDGEEAMRVLEERAGAVDLLVSDVVMPKMSGRDVHEFFRRAKPDAKTLFMSGYSTRVAEADYFERENAAFLSKPFSPAEFLRAVRKVLDTR